MADNIAITPGSGADVRTKDRAGVETQVVIVDRSGGATENLGFTGTTTFTDPACDTTADLLLAANTGRKVAIIQNAGTVDCYIGPSGVTTTSGLKLVAGATFVDDCSTSAWYGITAAGTADIRVCEVA